MDIAARYTAMGRAIIAMAALTCFAFLLATFLFMVDMLVDSRTIVQVGDLSSWTGMFYVTLIAIGLAIFFAMLTGSVGVVVSTGSDAVLVIAAQSPGKKPVATGGGITTSSLHVAGLVFGILGVLLSIFVLAVYGHMLDNCAFFNICCNLEDVIVVDEEVCTCESTRTIFMAEFISVLFGSVTSVVLLLLYFGVYGTTYRFTAQ